MNLKHGKYVGHYRARKEAIQIVCKIFNGRIPYGAVVHHADVDCFNNENSNLVVCEDNVYHLFLHQRLRAYNSCGNASWRKCNICKKYDDPKNLYINRTEIAHRRCRNRRWKKTYWENPEKYRALKRVSE